ncbi:MAG TPA: ACT domain-containing protein [Bryobacteraceae bacterium]|nr:ACT domain-containing protein [Bryobacteraceae bacterium]
MEKLHSQPVWHELQRQFFASGDAAPVLAGLSALIEGMTIEAFDAVLAAVPDPGVALLAVGGFGRRELFPCSDVDLLILIDRESQAAAIKDALAEFVRLLWDAGLRLSHSVRTVAECAELHDGNVELTVSLLDRRRVAGSHELFARLEEKLPAFLERQGRVLIRHLCSLARQRHQKFQNTLYHLEPNVKETPGGLRDLHLIHWVGKLRPPDSDVTARLCAPTAFLHSLRCFLHYQARRDQNLLTFDAQEELAAQPYLPFRDPAELMREYFRNARVIASEARRALDWYERSESSLASQFRDWRSRLSNTEFTVSNERVFLRSPAQLIQDPAIVLRLLEFIARHGVPVAAETERRLEQAASTFEAYCVSPPEPLWPRFRTILSLPHAAAALRVMHDTGLLPAMFPELKPISCLVVPDYYHRYTVDEHTLVAIEELAALGATKDPALARFAEIRSEIEDLSLLRLALLFHDSGKGARSGHHARISVELARSAMQRMQLRPEDESAVEFLIEHHLDLSGIMNSRDLFDPSTAALLAGRIGTLERLKLLTLLTYADISAVNPAAMTPWRLEQLWQTYRVAHQQLLQDLESDRIDNLPSGLEDPEGFLKGFPSRYLRTHTPDGIRAHLELYDLSRRAGAAVQLDLSCGIHRATIIARDRPALFASLAGGISSFGMEIVKAEAFSNAQGLVLDTFVFSDPARTLDLNPTENDRLRQTLEDIALGEFDAQRLRRRYAAAPRSKKRVETSVHFDSAACDTATLVEIVAEDRPGLLYDLSSVFSDSGCNIDVVLIDTEGSKAIDVFYVAANGSKLTSNIQNELQTKLLAIC